MKHVELLKGPIAPSLTALALPIMATSLMQMAYNMIDMIWIGRISANAVAAVGAAGMFMWLANGLVTLAKMGGQVKVAQHLGGEHYEEAAGFTQNALQLGIVFGIVFGLISILFARPLISFYHLNSAQVVNDAIIYLIVTCGFVVFSFVNQIFTGIMTAMGNSRSTFFATAVGLVINMILDPVLIFGFGFIPAMGILGAALATIIAQIIVTLMFVYFAAHDDRLFHLVSLKRKPDFNKLKSIIAIGVPAALQSILFTGISMLIARFIAGWGDGAIAVQKVGSQIESISWMSAEGFAAAVNSFTAQNFGARNMQRVKKGCRLGLSIVSIWGIFCTILLVFFPQYIFRVFIDDPSVLDMGVSYLRILGYSQLLMCIEITTTGMFSGLGKTLPPSIVSITLTSARIPVALWLMNTSLGLDGIWWALSISSILKGFVLLVWFMFHIKGKRYYEIECASA